MQRPAEQSQRGNAKIKLGWSEKIKRPRSPQKQYHQFVADGTADSQEREKTTGNRFTFRAGSGSQCIGADNNPGQQAGQYPDYIILRPYRCHTSEKGVIKY